MKMTTNIYLVTKLRTRGTKSLLPLLRFHGIDRDFYFVLIGLKYGKAYFIGD